ncbi:hypothetical protein [Bartonella koehlerae]|uniref:hypothetical protein n=1 Tax=Bartonella koehlerae TaxID=92181 RepID=UPI000AA908AD
MPSSSVKNIWTRLNKKVKHATVDCSGLHIKPIFVDRYLKSCGHIFKAAQNR